MDARPKQQPSWWTRLNLHSLDSENLVIYRFDQVNHTASGILNVGSGGVRVEIGVDTCTDLVTVAALLPVGREVVRVTNLLRLQERSRMARILYDPEDGVMIVPATSYCPGTTAIKTVFDLLARDIRVILSDGRLLTGRRMLAT